MVGTTVTFLINFAYTCLGVFILIGYSTASWVGVAFYFVNANGAQWRIPLALQIIAPLGLACGICFMPESPRWRK
jgi:hypothetical protein